MMRTVAKNSDVVPERGLTVQGARNPPQDVGQGGGVENSCGSVPYVFHHHSNTASVVVAAIAAAHIRRFADARNWGQRPLDNTQDLAEINMVRLTCQEVTSAFPFAALQNTVLRNSSRINSRNLRGIHSRWAMSEISTGPCPNSRASAIEAFNAYLDFWDNILTELVYNPSPRISQHGPHLCILASVCLRQKTL
jgi:hypothetical protein